jgi:hypothetical protein
MATPLVDGRGGRRRMRGSMDVVDAERLQRSRVAMVWVGKGMYIQNVVTDFTLLYFRFL